MHKLEEILDKAKESPYKLSKSELVFLLSLDNPEEQKKLFNAAYEIKHRFWGKLVNMRALIEIGNICAKNCFYCGIRCGNTKLKRYQLSFDDIIRMAKEAYKRNYGSLVLQSGEIETKEHTEFIAEILKAINDFSDRKLGITISLGEQTEEVYRFWKECGAHRYLLRIESSNKELYSQLHPKSHSFERRLECLKTLHRLNYQTGTGVMIGLPNQTMEHLADDILFFQNIDADMIGMGPYIPHKDTPMGKDITYSDRDKKTKLNLSLKMIACTRLQLHDINIAATTALQTLHPLGREQGIKAGANVIMPNATDTQYRESYKLYEDKPCLDENAEQCIECLKNRMRYIGEELNFGAPGDPLHYKNRNTNI